MDVCLPIRMVEKPWGQTDLPPPFVAPHDRRIGEIWFEPPPELDRLLVKYIFTGEKLSVQVHPSDTQTEAAGLGSQGKEECWLVIAAEPGAALGIGFEREYDEETLRAAALDGRIEQMLRWHPVHAGDFFSIPANTVHAIGAGISLIEVQQNSDITYRLYDYGRPRALHLEEALSVLQAAPYDLARHARFATQGESMLIDGPHFRMARLAGPPSAKLATAFATRPFYVIPISGALTVRNERIDAGDCTVALDTDDIRFPRDCVALLAQQA